LAVLKAASKVVKSVVYLAERKGVEKVDEKVVMWVDMMVAYSVENLVENWAVKKVVLMVAY